MARLRIGVRNLSAAELVIKGQYLIKSLTGNPHFPNPEPPLSTLNASVNDLKVKTIAAFHRDHIKVEYRRTAVDLLNKQISLLAAYVESQSKGKKEIILSSGFELRNKAEPLSKIAQVQKLRTRQTTRAGEIKLLWSPVRGAKAYLIQFMDMGFTGHVEVQNWEMESIISGSRHLISNLNSGHIYRFRVAAIGSAGQGPWSDVSEERTK